MKYIIRLFIILIAISSFNSCSNNKDLTDAYGIFEATEITISSENNGIILSLDLQEGVVYEKGQIVGCIDSTQLYYQLKQLSYSIDAALARMPDINTQLGSLQDKIAILNKEKSRITNLYEANAASAQQLDDVSAEVTITESQIQAMKSNLNMQSQSIIAEVEVLKFKKTQVEDAISKCLIKTPITGTILKKYIEPNELVFQGKPLFKIADLTNMYIVVYITEDMLSSLRIGQNTDIHVDTKGGKQLILEGKISWISSKAEFTPKMIQTKNERVNLVYAVKVAFKNDGTVKIGMPGNVTFK